MAPKRKGKKNTLYYALEVCDQEHLTTIVNSKDNIDSKESLQVLNFIKSTREVCQDNISPLQGAVSLGHYNICKHLLDEGAILMSMSSIPHPLCLALQKGHYDIAYLLIESGADVNLEFGNSLPISFALANTDCPIDIIKKIIDAGFPIDGVIDLMSKRSVLHATVIMNDISIAKYLFSTSANPNVIDKNGLTPLHYAVQRNVPEMVKLLIQNGAVIDCECTKHFTPMFYAIAAGNCDMVKLLLSLGADIHYINGNEKNPMRPLHFAASFCYFKATQLLLEEGADVNKKVPVTEEIALHAAAKADAKDKQSQIALDCIVELLIKYGSNVNDRNQFNLTPFHVAVKTKNYTVAKILIINGSELNERIRSGEKYCTIFHIAAKACDKELIQLLFDYGADCTILNEEELAPVHLTVMDFMLENVINTPDFGYPLYFQNLKEQLSVFRLFWKNGYPIDLTFEIKGLQNDRSSRVSQIMQLQKMLSSGIKHTQIKTVLKAMHQGAEIRCCTSEIPLPLHYLASRDSNMLLTVLLSKGYPANTLDINGETALHIAVRSGDIDSSRVLLEYGACYNYFSKNCPQTPLQLAKSNGYTDIVELLTSISDYFKALKKGRFKKLKPDMKIFNAVMNCCNREGLSLSGIAVRNNFKNIVDRLMKLRSLKNP